MEATWTNEITNAIGAEIQKLQEAKALLDGRPSSKPVISV
jgi:hypothetical protein